MENDPELQTSCLHLQMPRLWVPLPPLDVVLGLKLKRVLGILGKPFTKWAIPSQKLKSSDEKFTWVYGNSHSKKDFQKCHNFLLLCFLTSLSFSQVLWETDSEISRWENAIKSEPTLPKKQLQQIQDSPNLQQIWCVCVLVNFASLISLFPYLVLKIYLCNEDSFFKPM